MDEEEAPKMRITHETVKLDGVQFKQKVEQKVVEMKDEYDAEEFAALFTAQDRVIVKGAVPGAGKSYAIIKYVIEKKHAFVTPTNLLGAKAVEDAETKYISALNARTLYDLTGYAFGEGMVEKKKKRSEEELEEIMGLEVVVFDEIFCYRSADLFKIKSFMLEYPHIKYYATGDLDQNAPIDDANTLDYKSYYSEIVGSLFPTSILLKVNKRLLREEDKKTLLQIKEDIFVNNMFIPAICRKYFKILPTKDQHRGFGVSYLNDTADEVNRAQHEKEILSLDSDVGAVVEVEGMKLYRECLLRSRDHLKVGSDTIRRNFTYEVRRIEQDEGKTTKITLYEPLRKQYIDIKPVHLKKFTYTYAGTCHSTQGVTVGSLNEEGEVVNGEVTVYDVGHYCTTREWFWTAISRVRRLDLVHIVFTPGTGRTETKKRIKEKIVGVKSSDTDKKRKFEEVDFVDEEWTERELKRCNWTCFACSDALSVSGPYQFSINRINNEQAHTKDNCNIACFNCNRSAH